MTDLSGKSVIVTGAAQGIGAEYVRGLAAAGASVSVCDVLDPAEIVAEVNANGGRAIGRIADVSSPSHMVQVARETADAFGGIDALVNNAALFASLQRQPFAAISSEEWDRVVSINVRGAFEATKAVAPYMKQRNYGKIVNISSTTAFAGQPMLLYVASKGAIIAMTRGLARELGADGIRVNCIAPGFTLSEGVKSNAQITPQFTAGIAAARAIGRDQQPADLVGALLFLYSPASDFVTGQTVVVDGGMIMH
jgi:NAD(P)-dependent dehydrogenase (short-subunit alcohol dehydrogenase family)